MELFLRLLINITEVLICVVLFIVSFQRFLLIGINRQPKSF